MSLWRGEFRGYEREREGEREGAGVRERERETDRQADREDGYLFLKVRDKCSHNQNRFYSKFQCAVQHFKSLYMLP